MLMTFYVIGILITIIGSCDTLIQCPKLTFPSGSGLMYHGNFSFLSAFLLRWSGTKKICPTVCLRLTNTVCY